VLAELIFCAGLLSFFLCGGVATLRWLRNEAWF